MSRPSPQMRRTAKALRFAHTLETNSRRPSPTTVSRLAGAMAQLAAIDTTINCCID